MPLILIDTNVLVYTHEKNEPGKQDQAIRVLKSLEANGRLSVQCLSEFVNVTIRRLIPLLTIEEAIIQVERLIHTYPIFPLTPMIILEAARGVKEHSLSYYDAQIWASARLNQVPVIFSEDFSDEVVLEGVRFVNPFASEFVLEDWVA
jgi:predicted nucleic acid-binding protein